MYNIQLLTLTLLTAGCFSVRAQVQNTNFEDWTLTDTLWNGELVYSASQWPGGTRTEDSYSGNYAAKVEPYMSCGVARNYMIYGAVNPNHFNLWTTELDFTGSGSPINFKPDELTGYFKFPSPQAEDEATGQVILKKFNPSTGISSEVGRGEIQFAPFTSYAPFTIYITDLQPGIMPDSIVIAFSSGTGYGWENDEGVTGNLYIDQLRIKKGSSIAGVEENSVIQSRIYPNPVTDELHLAFETAAQDQFTLVIVDASGRKVISREVKPGEESIVEIKHLTSGTYIASIQGRDKVYATETILKKD